MIKLKNLIESLEDKYNLNEVYDNEVESEIDSIMDDDSLSKDEKEKFVSKILTDYNEDLNTNSITEDLSKKDIQDKIEDALSEIASKELYDNIVMRISSLVPEYNPDWFGDSDGFDTTYEKLDNAELEAQDKYIKAIANRLMAAYEGE